MIFKRKQEKRGSENAGVSVEDWPDYVVTLDGKNFDEFIRKYPLSMIDFWAPWCAPCKTIAPRVRRLSKIFKGKVAFGRLNTQKNQDVAKQYNVMSIPHLMFFSHGKKISSLTGVRSVGDVKDLIDDLLKKIDR